MAHSNQEDQQNAHSNQETVVGLSALPAGRPPAPAALFADIETGAGFEWRAAASRAWMDAGMPPDPGEQGAAGAVVGLRAPDAPGGGPGSGESALAPRPQGVIPTPGGLGLLVLAVLAGGRRRRRRERRA